ncbi:MAG: ADP-ribosylation factor-like protein [Promethearchaeota archaeon]
MDMKPIKISLIGEQNAGKTTLRKLMQGEEIDPHAREPTIGVDVGRVEMKDRPAAVWDLGGQARFRFMWDMFTRGTDLAIFVTDSTSEGVEMTKRLMEQYQRVHQSKIIAIANKQDLPGAMHPAKIQERLGVKTYGTVAIDNGRREELFSILESEASGLKA